MKFDINILIQVVPWAISGIVWLSSIEFRLKSMKEEIKNKDVHLLRIQETCEEIKNRLVRVETLLEKDRK
jgi:hypothetical protein